MNRIDRLSAILIQLQSRRVVKAQDIADRFEISLRTVYRDIKALEEGGVPVIGEAGVGYSIVDGYRLPPVMFTREEAAAFLTAEKLVEKLTDNATSNDFNSAMFKVKAVLKSTEKDFLENLDSHIEVVKNRRQLPSKSNLNLLPAILKSISAKKAIEINYFTNYRQEQTQRCIEPIGIIYLENYWHLIAYCKLRNAIRDFRMDRINGIKTTEDSYSQKHPTLQKYLQQGYKKEDLQEVIIRVDRNIYSYLDEQKYYNGFVSEIIEADHVIMNFFTCSITGFARWFLMFGDKASIIKSDLLSAKVKELLVLNAERLQISYHVERVVPA